MPAISCLELFREIRISVACGRTYEAAWAARMWLDSAERASDNAQQRELTFALDMLWHGGFLMGDGRNALEHRFSKLAYDLAGDCLDVRAPYGTIASVFEYEHALRWEEGAIEAFYRAHMLDDFGF